MADILSGIKIPDSKIAREAAELVRQHETEMLYNHSVRVFVFGAMKGVRQNLKFDSELLYVAALFHDLGLVDAYHTDTKRFEVDGADAARQFLRSHGISEPKADLVWEAIALHTTPGIPRYMRPEIALTNDGRHIHRRSQYGESNFLIFSRERARVGGSPILKVSDRRPADARIQETRDTSLRVRD
jgi:hypothetical protein